MKNIELNFFQTISATGIPVSVAAQLGLLAMDKHVDNFWAVYPTWVAVFIMGTIIRIVRKDTDDHHH